MHLQLALPDPAFRVLVKAWKSLRAAVRACVLCVLRNEQPACAGHP